MIDDPEKQIRSLESEVALLRVQVRETAAIKGDLIRCLVDIKYDATQAIGSKPAEARLTLASIAARAHTAAFGSIHKSTVRTPVDGGGA